MEEKSEIVRLAFGLFGFIAIFASIFLTRKRIRRLQFTVQLAASIFMAMLSILVIDYINQYLGVFLFLSSCCFLYHTLAARMNDIGHSRFWVILTTTIIGMIIIPMLIFIRSNPTEEELAQFKE